MSKFSFSESHIFCKPKTSFTYKLLVALNRLEHTKYFYRGVGLDELENFMKKNFSLTGDVRSQIQNAIHYAEKSRLVLKKMNGYILLPPAASLHNVPVSCVKARIEDVQKRFNNIFYEVESSCQNTNTHENFTDRRKSVRNLEKKSIKEDISQESGSNRALNDKS